jgi:hypothetical protein
MVPRKAASNFTPRKFFLEDIFKFTNRELQVEEFLKGRKRGEYFTNYCYDFDDTRRVSRE